MTRAAVLVPAPDYGEAWDWAYDVEAAALFKPDVLPGVLRDNAARLLGLAG